MTDLFWLGLLLLLLGFGTATMAVEGIVRSMPAAVRTKHMRGIPLVLLTGLPWLALVGLMVGVVAVFAGKHMGLLDDHCLAHGVGHPHLCMSHLSLQQTNWLSSVLLALLVIGFAVRMTQFGVSFRQRHHIQKNLSRLNQRSFLWVESSKLFAFVAGCMNPRVFLSTALKSKLSKRHQRIVVAHEIQHVRNRDPLLMWCIELMLTIFTKRTRSILRQAWNNQRELRVDHQVAQRFGRTQVAQCLLAMAHSKRTEKAVHHSHGSLELRITTLIDGRTFSVAPTMRWLVSSCLLISTLVVIEHHALETIIGWINSW